MPLVRAWKLSHRNVGTNSATLSNGHQTQRSLINMASPVTRDFANGNKPMRSWVPGSYALGLLPGFQGSWSPKSPLGLSEDEVGCRTGPLEALISIERVYKAQLVSEPFNLGTTRLFRSPMWVPHMRGWIISWDTYLWLDSWILVSLLLFSPPKISWMILSISLLYVFLWNILSTLWSHTLSSFLGTWANIWPPSHPDLYGLKKLWNPLLEEHTFSSDLIPNAENTIFL